MKRYRFIVNGIPGYENYYDLQVQYSFLGFVWWRTKYTKFPRRMLKVGLNHKSHLIFGR